MVGLRLDTQHAPDLIIAGRSNVALPVIKLANDERTIMSPFYFETSNELACRIVDEIAFGVGLVHLLWALDHIELGSMPWDRILGNGLNL